MDKYSRYNRGAKGRARTARYRSTGRENVLRWMRRLRESMARKEAAIRHLEEQLNG